MQIYLDTRGYWSCSRGIAGKTIALYGDLLRGVVLEEISILKETSAMVYNIGLKFSKCRPFETMLHHHHRPPLRRLLHMRLIRLGAVERMVLLVAVLRQKPSETMNHYLVGVVLLRLVEQATNIYFVRIPAASA